MLAKSALKGSHLTKSAGPGGEQAPNFSANTLQKGAREHSGQAVHAVPQQQNIQFVTTKGAL